MSPTRTQDWRQMWERVASGLEARTGVGVQRWNRRIHARRFTDEGALRTWLLAEGVTGYAQSLLVMERFGYPEFLRASATDLVDAQFRDRPALRPIYERLVAECRQLGDVTVQARKTYVALVGARRTFARVRATTRTRLDLGLRIEGARPAGRLGPARIHPSLTVEVGLRRRDDVDGEVRAWLELAFAQSGPGTPEGPEPASRRARKRSGSRFSAARGVERRRKTGSRK